MPYYKTIYSHAKSINSEKEYTEFKENNKKSGMVRVANAYSYYFPIIFLLLYSYTIGDPPYFWVPI